MTRSIDATRLVQLFIENMFSKHSTSSHVTSNRGVELVSKFFKSLANGLNMKLHFTSGYHPEADSQIEHTNQTLEKFLRIYCNYQQSDWFQLLSLVEFTYNNTPSFTTRTSPFFANKGYRPRVQFQVQREPPRDTTNNFISDLKKIHDKLKQTIQTA